jgi:hypothetical protein
MKLYSQNGFGEGERAIEGLQAGYIDGAILSPRDCSPSSLAEKASKYRDAKDDAQILFDPQFYASIGRDSETSRLGHLLEDYGEYFRPRRRSTLERENSVKDAIRECLNYQLGMEYLDAVISPNIMISKSIDSAEALIAKNFIRLSAEVYREMEGAKPLLATLAVSRDALSKEDFLEFVNEITALDAAPDGFYILLAAKNTNDRSEIFNSRILAYWMYLNYVLATVNGFQVVNGFSDLVSPLLSAAGASASATGWWSNLRTFSLSRFDQGASGGKLPTPRYLSKMLVNRITFSEFDQLRKLIPTIVNGLQSDYDYPEGEQGSEPYRNREVLQSWDALNSLCSELDADDTVLNLNRLREILIEARAIYDHISAAGIQLDIKSGPDHLEELEMAIEEFKLLAELNS